MGAPEIEIEGHADIERIGNGGVGVVYRATRLSTGRVVAIKVLRDVSDESVAWHRTRRELTALVALAGHANVIQLFELFDLEQGPALSMEYAQGGSVADLLERRDHVLAPAETVLIGKQTAAALAAAHAQGIVHRDIKPQNLLIDGYGQIKLCDFGIASLTRTEGFRTRTNAWSMRYASPEDLDGDSDVGPASDVYSLGATLLHVAHGAPPSLKDRLQEWVPPVTDDPHQAELDQILASCLHPQSGRRPSANELVERLERLGWTLGERCRALPVEGPPPIERSARLFGEREHSVGFSELVAVGSTPGLTAPGSRRLGDPSVGSSVDATLLRAGRRPPDRPSVRPPARRRWPLVVTGVVAALVIGIAIAVLWPRGSGESGAAVAPTTIAIVESPPTVAATAPVVEAQPTTTSAVAVAGQSILTFVDRPEGLVAIDDASVVWPFGGVGECLVQVVDVTELRTVPCQQPHDLQRVAVAELDPAEFPPAAVFDHPKVQVAVETACTVALDSFVWPNVETQMLDVPVTRPSAASWQQGDRRFQCLLGIVDQRIVGDATA